MAAILDHPWLRDSLKRRLTLTVAALAAAILCFWPRHYVAKSELLWEDTNGGGLSSILGRAGGGGVLNLGSLVGSHQSIEADLTIGRSQAVVRDVIAHLHLIGRPGFPNAERAEIKLRHKVDVAAMRGSILQIMAKDQDPVFAQTLVGAYTAAIKDRLTVLALQQARQKQVVTTRQIAETEAHLASAQTAITNFRIENKLAAPEVQLGAAVANLAQLQGRLQAREAQLSAAQQFATGANIQVQMARAEIAGLRDQITAAQLAVPTSPGPTLVGMAAKITQYTNLYRDEQYYQSAYEIYKRYMEEVRVDELSATTNMDIIEPAYILPERQINLPFVGLFVLLIAVAIGAEFYLVRPPIGRR